MSFYSIIEKYRQDSFSKRDQGDRFERLMLRYLKTEPMYASTFKEVWLWQDFPYRDQFSKQDIGIDLVAETHDGDFWSVQCKCYSEKNQISKADVDTFIATSNILFIVGDKWINFKNLLWLSTTNNWSSHAEETIKNQRIPFVRKSLNDLENAEINWEYLEQGKIGKEARKERKPKDHQVKAIEKTIEYFKENDRGKLIMACGTGKTYTSLLISEKQTNLEGLVLFLVPSIALMRQTLKEWSAFVSTDIHAKCICSDSKVTQEKRDGGYVVDLAMPASTDVDKNINHFDKLKNKKGLKVVFSTYQSIRVVAEVQQKYFEKNGKDFGIFDLIICDEAHRTTGAAAEDEKQSHFVKVHDKKFIEAKKRLYMTATPRIYSEKAKKKAEKDKTDVWSMDDNQLYGNEIYRIGFGKAVDLGLLCDYKVLIMAVDKSQMPKSFIGKENQENLQKMIGCFSALSKRTLKDKAVKEMDPPMMKRAVAFCSKIKTSKETTRTFNKDGNDYWNILSDKLKNETVQIKAKHIDGTMNASERDELLGWLKEDATDNECRILDNARCLSEGVDVPTLDAILFLAARNSQVDVVQSVGRVMRTAPGKKYGYIIIPVIIDFEENANEQLDKNKEFEIVWSVLNALRAHDDRFNAIVNKIDLNKNKPTNIVLGGTDIDGWPEQNELALEEFENVIYGRLVNKVGSKEYWENWAGDIAKIAQKQINRLSVWARNDKETQELFSEFLEGLRESLNPNITEENAIEMMAQHSITKPVFDALFEGYSFIENNPVSKSMEGIVSLLEMSADSKDLKKLEGFYNSVRERASNIDNYEGKQRVIIELYDNFFKKAFPKMVEQLGIVYTPVEVVDFMINSVNDVLKKEFGTNLSKKDVHILDPFTGTGTFIVRLLQSGLIKPVDFLRKYQNEIWANEIVLLAYYIAAINIEAAFYDCYGHDEYQPFKNICLTDTFQISENEDENYHSENPFVNNTNKIQEQKKAPIKVIISNPPYSIGQKSQNDNAANIQYQKLNKKIEDSYAKKTNAGLKKSLYDSYIRAFRWASDRIRKTGIICFVSNGVWLEGKSQDGFRKCLCNEFNKIYVYNLRGNARTNGEIRKKEGGNIFDSGSRTPITITLLIKNSDVGPVKIFYNDIGDYLSKKDKLEKIKTYNSISKIKWNTIKPSDDGDWLNLKDKRFNNFYKMIPPVRFIEGENIFNINSLGVVTNRDSWCYNFNLAKLKNNINLSLSFYENQRIKFGGVKNAKENINYDSTKISWSRSLIYKISNNIEIIENNNSYRISLYRPFEKINLYFDRNYNEVVYKQPLLFPEKNTKNFVICIHGNGGNKNFSALISNYIPDLNMLDAGSTCFPLYWYNKKDTVETNFLFSDNEKYERFDGITNWFLEKCCKKFNTNSIIKEDIFYYIYGILHSKEFIEIFTNDLKKSEPRIPLVDSYEMFRDFSDAGKKLAELHLDYEHVVHKSTAVVSGDKHNNFKVKKMKFIKKGQRDTIIFNNYITITNIPEKAYEYVVNGKSPIEWVMDRYQVKTDKKSGITNDPNDWANEVGNPRYILDLLLSVITLSEETIDIVNNLPVINFDTL